jgi:hypothetical protein
MSERLIWLQDLQNKIIISDLNGTNTYQLNSPKQLRVSWFLPTYFSLSRKHISCLGFRCRSIKNPRLYYFPDTSTIPIVIPDSVDLSSILLKPILDGGLVITWSPITNVNYGNVSYDIRVSYKNENCTAVSILWFDVAFLMKQNSVFFLLCVFFFNFRSSHV